MRKVSIACVVEGFGEVEALPILLRRIVTELDPNVMLHIPQPVARISRSKIIRPGELEKEVETAARKNTPSGAILILLDADDDCAATLGPQLPKRARAARSDRPIAVVLANKEYEAWFLAAAVSLRGVRRLSETLEPPANPESIRGAKEWLIKATPRGQPYDPAADQSELTRHFNLEAARACASFDKLYRDIERLLAELNPPVPAPEISPAPQ